MALSLASLCSRRGRTASSLPSQCGDSSPVSDYDLKNKYGLVAPEPGAVYFLPGDIVDDTGKLAIQAELSGRLSLFIVDNCVTHLMRAVADIQMELRAISTRLRILMKGGLSMYIGLMALAAAAGLDMLRDVRRLAADGVFAPSDLDTQIVYIGQDNSDPNDPLVDAVMLDKVRAVVVKVLRGLNETLRSDTLFEKFVSELAVERGVHRAVDASDLVISLEPGLPGNRDPSKKLNHVDLTKVALESKYESPYFVSTNDSIPRFHLWRNKLVVGYTDSCSVKLELLDVSMVRKSDGESRSIVRGLFGASAETDLVARLLAARLIPPAAVITDDQKLFVQLAGNH